MQLYSTIFHEPWWMEIACAGAQREVTVSAGGRILGRLPYLLSKRGPGLTALGMPSMTHVLGPTLAVDETGQNSPGVVKQISIVEGLVAQLPKASHILFRLHGGVTNTLAFNAAGFFSSVDFTVEILPVPPEEIWRQMRDKTRNVIRRAQERLTVDDTISPDQFIRFYEDNLQEKGLTNHYNRSICLMIVTECLRRGVGRLLAAREPSGKLQAAIFTVWDDRSEYYFMSTRTPGSMNGAISLTIWEAIQHAAAKGLIFDMDGMHVKNNRLPNLLLLTGFGGTIKPRYVVQRSSPAIQMVQRVKELFRARSRA
jgi:hypothetical protein